MPDVNRGKAPVARLTVVCDLDGTLVDSAPDLAGALNTVLAERGIPTIAFEDVRPLVGAGVLALIQRALARSGDAERHDAGRLLDRFLEVYELRLTRESRPYPGVRETLGELSEHGRRLAVCTNKPEYLARRMLDDLGLDHFGDAVVGGDTFDYRKPDPRALGAAVSLAGGDPLRSVLVGDSRTDVETARNAEVPAILVTYGYRTDPVDALAPDIVVERFAAVAGAVRRLERP